MIEDKLHLVKDEVLSVRANVLLDNYDPVLLQPVTTAVKKLNRIICKTSIFS